VPNSLVNALLADAVLLLHIAFVLFVVLSLVLIYIGKLRNWPWVRNRWFRAVHLSCIVVVVLQAWLGIICPLTTLEMHLRKQAGEATYPGSFVAHWLGELLYYDAPHWVFAATYTLFGLAVAVSWVYVRPDPFRRR